MCLLTHVYGSTGSCKMMFPISYLIGFHVTCSTDTIFVYKIVVLIVVKKRTGFLYTMISCCRRHLAMVGPILTLLQYTVK